MPILFPRGLTITTDEAIDSRLILTKAQMVTVEDDFMMPEHYFCLCSDDNQIYIYDINNSIIENPDEEYYGLGRFRPAQVELEEGNGITIKDKDTLEVDLTELSEGELTEMLLEYGSAILSSFAVEPIRTVK